MAFVELSVDVSKLDDVQRDMLGYMLGSYGFEGVVEDGDYFLAYVKDINPIDREALISDLNELAVETELEMRWGAVEEKNWNELWEKDFHPVTIAGLCHIRASFHPEYKKAAHEIIIDPKMAFGTGHHETTTMMVEMILENEFRDKAVLDMGCGTGVLAILSAMKGANPVDAVDNDIWSYENTKENLLLNGIKNVNVFHGDVKFLKNRTYEIIIANINRNILLDDIPEYAKSLKVNGVLMLSGFYETDVPALEEKAGNFGLTLETQKSKNNWSALAFVKTKS